MGGNNCALVVLNCAQFFTSCARPIPLHRGDYLWGADEMVAPQVFKDGTYMIYISINIDHCRSRFNK